MSLDIDSQYTRTIEKLKNGIRPHKLYSFEEGQALIQRLDKLMLDASLDEREINKILCLLEHCQCHGVDFSESLIRLLQKPLSNDCLIFSIATSIKWVVEDGQKRGYPLTFDFMNIIKYLLQKYVDHEVREWILRLIDSTGNQSLKFKSSVLAMKKDVSPKFLRKSTQHNKNSYEIILSLEKRWEHILGGLK